MSPTRRDEPKPSGSPGRGAILAGGLALVATAVAVGALAVTLIRTGGQGTCRSTAWTAVPDAEALPAGWSTASSRVFVDNLTMTIGGPTPSGSTQAPAVFVSVNCYGDDAALALRRSHEAALAAGSTNASFASLGDDSFAVHGASANTTTVYVKRGALLADVTAPSSVDASTLESLAKAVDDAMQRAIAAGPDASGPAPAPPAPATPAASAPEPSATAAPVSHVATDLEALLPTKVAGTTLSTQSVLGTAALGSDTASQALIASLQKLGKTAADLQVAVAYDPQGDLELRLFAYRLAGVTSADLDRAIVGSQLVDASPMPQQSQVTVSGHPTTRLTYSQGSVYYYDYDGVVIAVQAADESLAAQALALFK